MSSQGADERRIRRILVTMGVGPDAAPASPTPNASPTAAGDPSDAWWDKLYADEQPAVPRQPSPRLPDWWRPKAEQLPAAPEQSDEQTADTPTNTTPASENTRPSAPEPAAPAKERPASRTPRPAPPQSLLDAWDGIRPRTRWLIHHATAAAAGWPIGLVDWGSNTAAWFAAGHWTAPSAWVLYGLGLCAISLYRRARAWAWPAAWAAAIPVSSVTVGVLLYAPTP